MKRAVIWSGFLIMLTFMLALLAAGLRQGPAAQDTAQGAVQAEGQDAAAAIDPQVTLRLKSGGAVEPVTLQAYLTGVLACEMPLDFDQAALQAQAVAARTFTLYQCAHGKHTDCDVCDDSACCQAWASETDLAERFGDGWEDARQRALEAVTATDGVVLTSDGALIDAVYFACSGGRTEAAAAVWGTDVPYLQAVDSPGEEQAASYTGQVDVSFADFCSILQAQDPAVALTGPAASWFGDTTQTPGGGVATTVIGGRPFTGTQLRQLFGLNSTCFTVAVTQDGIEFTTKGKGHRVGMSQYGAQAMAQAGSDYAAILQHYYTGATLTVYAPS